MPQQSDHSFFEDLYKRTEDKLDSLSSKVDENHKELTKSIHELDLKVLSQHERLSFAKWALNTSGPIGFFLAIVALCKDFIGFPHK